MLHRPAIIVFLSAALAFPASLPAHTAQSRRHSYTRLT